jgi:hypothetical protein
MLATSLSNLSCSRPVRGFATLFLFVPAVALIFLPKPAEAVTNILVNDTWKDGNDMEPFTTNSSYAENNGLIGNDADADGNLESAWFQGGGGALDPVAANGPLRGTVTTSSSSWTTFFTQEETPVQLNATGDSIKVTWSFRLNTINASNTSQGLHIALVDSPSGSRLTANGSSIDGEYRGYGIFANIAPTLGNGSPFQLRKRSISTGNVLASSGNWTAVGNGATTGNHGYDENTEYTLTWQITRRLDNGLDIDAKMVGGTLNTTGTAQALYTDTTPVGDDPITGPFGSYKFDTFALRPSSGGQAGGLTADTFDTTLFKVEFTTTAVAPGVPGDYNNNGVVDAADYVLWRKGGALQNEVDNPGTVNTADYTAWRARFGNNSGSGASLSAAAVPEPQSILLFIAGVAGLAVSRRSR